MLFSNADEEDVLDLLTGEDEFDADIDEDAEELLLRDDTMASNGNDSNRHPNLGHSGQSADNASNNKSIDDEEDDEDNDDGRRGRFRSERIMSISSVSSRRRDIPDSLDAIKVNLDQKSDKHHEQ